MPQEEAYFVGILANADSSILPLKLRHGFRLEAISGKEGFDLFSDLEQIPRTESYPLGILAQVFYGIEAFNQNEDNFIVVRNSFSYERDPDPLSNNTYLGAALDFRNKYVFPYLDPAIRLMRLFKEGDIRMPWSYYYLLRDGKLAAPIKFLIYKPVSKRSYHVDASETEELQQFIHATAIPLSEPFLQLAFENFELSYEIHNPHLSFLTLMVSLETLLNPAAQELGYRISRNIAVLLGKNREESERIHFDIKKFYAKRSQIAHSGKSRTLSEDDVSSLRDYVRRAIKQISKIGKGKEEILNLLNILGFGEIESVLKI